MKCLVILSSVLLLSGCATGCREACVFGFGPGNSVFDKYAEYSDKQDPCQRIGKPDNYVLPNYCGSSIGKTVRIQQVNKYRSIVTIE